MPKSKKQTKETSATTKKSSKRGSLPTIDRQRMVSEAAYYLAERRGFESGGELGDWLEAEQQVSSLLKR